MKLPSLSATEQILVRLLKGTIENGTSSMSIG